MTAIIEVKDLSMQYRDILAVDNLSLTIHEGEIFGIIGHNGAGKTTLVECIEGMRKPSSGRISVLQQDPYRDRAQLSHNIGIQLQSTEYPNKARVHEICQLFSSFYQDPADYRELLTKLGMGDHMRAKISKLSGGQKQKLSIALALLNKPKIVFLDELTTGLDPKARHIMWDIIRDFKQEGITVVLISHYLDEIEALCDRIAVMNRGKITHLGTIQEVIGNAKNTTHVTLDAAVPAQLEPLAASLAYVAEVTVTGTHFDLTLTSSDAVSDLMILLAEQRVHYTNLSVRTDGLEPIFLQMMGYDEEGETAV
jgi:ABC-2 type transport system ATP-binding protein